MEDGVSDVVVLQVKVLKIEKDGNVYKYEIHTVTNMEKFSQPEMTTCRLYEDLEWLHWCIEHQPNTDGNIVPPLPRRPVGLMQQASLQSKQPRLGDEDKLGTHDSVEKCCQAAERYLQLLANHPVFRRNDNLHQFLDTEELPATIRTKKGWVQSLTHAVEEVRLHGRKDVDEFFGGQRSFITESAVRLKEASIAFERMLRSQCSVSTSLSQLNSSLSLTASSLSSGDPLLYRVLLKFGEGIDVVKIIPRSSVSDKSAPQVVELIFQKHSVWSGLESVTLSDDLSLGVMLNLYEKYTLRAKAMLHERSVCMQRMESTKKAAEKAPPKKQEAAEKAKEEADTKFTEMSVVAKRELVQFHEQRVRSFQSSLIELAESQLAAGRESVAQLAKTLAELTRLESI